MLKFLVKLIDNTEIMEMYAFPCIIPTSSLTIHTCIFYLTLIYPLSFSCSNFLEMDSTAALETITLGQHNCKVFGHLLRLWDAVNVKSKFADPLISIDGVLLDEHVRTYF
jgi:hypothetical protein